MTAALVVGSAPCLHDDMTQALKVYPDAYVCTVNGACAEIEKADAIVAGHTNKAEIFADARRKAFPDGKPFEVFANWVSTHRIDDAKTTYPSVTKWFDGNVSTGATSAAKAARMLLLLGFGPVILCGCPLDDSGYFPGESQKGRGIAHDCRRVGDPEQNEHRSILGYRKKFKALAVDEFKDKVFSMSGLTREYLGLPPGVKDAH